jgi:hypothetical protein
VVLNVLKSKPIMKVLHILTLLASAAVASVLPRTSGYVPANHCCFTLHDASTGTIVRQNEAGNGQLYLGGTLPEGWYCIDLPAKRNILIDRLRNSCYRTLRNEINCHDPIPSDHKWTLVKTGGKTMVAINGETTYKACPSETGREQIFGTARTECRSFTLEARGLTGTC